MPQAGTEAAGLKPGGLARRFAAVAAVAVLAGISAGGNALAAPGDFGVRQVADLNPPPEPGFPDGLTNVNGTVFFAAFSDAAGYELWKTDGTAAGTTLVEDINPGDDVNPGTPDAGILSPGSMTSFGGLLWFSADDGVNGEELWRSDGTAAGTFMIELNPNPGQGSDPTGFRQAGSKLFFVAEDGGGTKVWFTTGGMPTSVGPADATQIGTSGENAFVAANEGILIGNELLVATPPHTSLQLRNINPNASPNHSSNPASFTDLDGSGTVIFSATNVTTNTEVWKSNGGPVGPGGTEQIEEIAAGNTGSSPNNFGKVGSRVFFNANDNTTTAFEPYVTDGTPAGTGLVKNINMAPNASSNPGPAADLNGIAIFSADDGVNGRALWRSDGTGPGTTMVKDININPGGDPEIGGLTSAGGIIYFSANDGTHGHELWRTDGTEAGTFMVDDINPDAGNALGGPFAEVASVGSDVFFRADDGTTGNELWRTFTEPFPPAAAPPAGPTGQRAAALKKCKKKKSAKKRKKCRKKARKLPV